MPPSSTTEGIYYLRLNGKVEGPFTIGQIYDLWAARKINSQTAFARFEEMDKWQPLSELTLKISSTKTTKAPTPPAEPASQQAQTRQRQSSLAAMAAATRTEEYSPAMVIPSQEKVASPSRKAAQDPLAALQSRLMRPGVGIAVCIGLGGVVAVYFAFLYPGPGRRESLHDLLVVKQTGVLSGIGLILLGGLLIVAQQLDRLRQTIESGGKSQTKDSTS